MSPLPPTSKQKFIIATLLLLVILACGPLNRLQQFNRQDFVKPTQTIPVERHKPPVDMTGFYARIETLPGYRLESVHILRDSTGHHTREILVVEHDGQGNVHVTIHDPDGQQREWYTVAGTTYKYQPEYNGWVHSVEDNLVSEVSPTKLKHVRRLLQMTAEAETQPTMMKRETRHDRPVTRYAFADTIQPTANAAVDSTVDLRGALWVDDETGAVLRSEAYLYESDGSLPTQEFILDVSAIGDVGAITAPTPIVDPVAIVSATATAQAQLVLPARLTYQDEQLSFEIIPERVTQTGEVSPRRAEVQLILQQLPAGLFQAADFEPFLAQLRQQLTLSIPERNLVVTSSGFRLESQDAKNHSLAVVYSFNIDLEDFSHVELILSGSGNPLFVPVPVE